MWLSYLTRRPLASAVSPPLVLILAARGPGPRCRRWCYMAGYHTCCLYKAFREPPRQPVCQQNINRLIVCLNAFLAILKDDRQKGNFVGRLYIPAVLTKEVKEAYDLGIP